MKFDTILEYQRIDQELIAIENDVAKCKERQMLFSAKQKLDEATSQISKLSAEAGEIFASYEKLQSELNALHAKLAEFDGIIEEVKDAGEANYYLKQVENILFDIAMLEKDANKDISHSDGVSNEFKKTWNAGIQASDAYKQANSVYTNYVAKFQPKVTELQAQLNALKKDIPEEFLKAYIALRNAKKMPAFVEYDPSKPRCGRCFMDLAVDVRSKLKVSGDYAECPNCRRILFIP